MLFVEFEMGFFKFAYTILVIRETSSDVVPACRIKIESSSTSAGRYLTTTFTQNKRSSMAEQVLSDCGHPYRVVWFITCGQHANIFTNQASPQAVESELSAEEHSCSTNVLVPAAIQTYSLGLSSLTRDWKSFENKSRPVNRRIGYMLYVHRKSRRLLNQRWDSLMVRAWEA